MFFYFALISEYLIVPLFCSVADFNAGAICLASFASIGYFLTFIGGLPGRLLGTKSTSLNRFTDFSFLARSEFLNFCSIFHGCLTSVVLSLVGLITVLA